MIYKYRPNKFTSTNKRNSRMNPSITNKILLLEYLTVVKNKSGVGIFLGVTPCIHVMVTSSSGK